MSQHTLTTPAEELRDAAARIRDFAKDTTPADAYPSGWLGHADEQTGHAFIFGGPVQDGYRTGTVFEFRHKDDCDACVRPSSADLNWIWLMSPELADPLAKWLEAVAAGWQRSTDLFPGGAQARFGDHPALAVARAINGGES